MKFITIFSRYIVGILFIVSGLIKANDPSGFAIKLEEYFTVFGVEWLSTFSIFLSISICALEIIMGFALLIGYKAKQNAWALLILILFFTWLTGFSAVTGKVTDCGCFGDAIKLTPWQSFYKDLVLLFFISIIFLRRNSIIQDFNNSKSKISMSVVSLLAFGFGIHSYIFLPVVDFLPYKVGNNIAELMKVPDGAAKDVYESKMYYSKNGEIKEFNTSNYPWDDSTWTWVETKNVLVKEGYKAPIHDFKISDAEGNDYTEDLLMNPDFSLWIISKDVVHCNKTSFLKMVFLAEKLNAKIGLKTIAITASSPYDTEYFRHDLNAAFPFYFGDGTALKSMIRSNPGVMLMKTGKVIMKWPSSDLPDQEEIEELIKKNSK